MHLQREIVSTPASSYNSKLCGAYTYLRGLNCYAWPWWYPDSSCCLWPCLGPRSFHSWGLCCLSTACVTTGTHENHVWATLKNEGHAEPHSPSLRANWSLSSPWAWQNHSPMGAGPSSLIRTTQLPPRNTSRALCEHWPTSNPCMIWSVWRDWSCRISIAQCNCRIPC